MSEEGVLAVLGLEGVLLDTTVSCHDDCTTVDLPYCFNCIPSCWGGGRIVSASETLVTGGPPAVQGPVAFTVASSSFAD